MSDLVAILKEKQNGLGQVEYAAKLGISQGFLSQILSGQRAIGIDTCRRIVECYPELKEAVAEYATSHPEEVAA